MNKQTIEFAVKQKNNIVSQIGRSYKALDSHNHPGDASISGEAGGKVLLLLWI